MKSIEELFKHIKNCKYFLETASLKNKKTITEDSLLSFWDNEYDEAWNVR
jgi:hypothetical protein